MTACTTMHHYTRIGLRRDKPKRTNNFQQLVYLIKVQGLKRTLTHHSLLPVI